MSSRQHGPEQLRVYHLARDYARQLDVLLRRERVHHDLEDQLIREANSIILNIAEGCGYYSPGKKLYHYQIAYASGHESIGGLHRLGDMRPRARVRPLIRTVNMTCVMLMNMIHTQQRRKDTP